MFNVVKKLTYVVSDIDKALAFEWIAERINRSRIELSFILILQRPSQLETFLKDQKIPVYCFYYANKAGLMITLFRVYLRLKSLKSEIIHCHLLYGSMIGLTAGWMSGIGARIYTRHHSDFHHRYFPRGIKWDKWCNTIATRIIAPSNAVREVLIEMECVCPEKVSLIPHGFKLEYFRNPRQELIDTVGAKYLAHGRYPVIGVISRFTELKGIQYIIPAFLKLLKKYPDALILFFNAQGNYEPAIRQLLNSVPQRNYRLISFENELAAVYHLFEVFIQVSTDTRIEAFGQTYVEALASGVPSVFTLSGIAVDFVKDGENALVVPFEDSDAIYFAVRKILEEQGLKEKLTAGGWNSVKERFALQHMIKQLEDLYEKR